MAHSCGSMALIAVTTSQMAADGLGAGGTHGWSKWL
jgi:hypothetical protein